MSEASQYKDTIIDTIIKMLKDNLPNGYFKAYYYGDPIIPPTSLLPCVIVEKRVTDIPSGGESPTGMDLLKTTVRIKLAYNKRDDFGKNPEEVVGVRSLEQYAEGRDRTTGEYDAQSVAGILRKNFTMGNIVVDQRLRIEYGVVPRPQEMITAEAWIDCDFTELITVTGRS